MSDVDKKVFSAAMTAWEVATSREHSLRHTWGGLLSAGLFRDRPVVGLRFAKELEQLRSDFILAVIRLPGRKNLDFRCPYCGRPECGCAGLVEVKK